LYESARCRAALQQTSVSLHAANGTKIEVLGIANIELNMKGHKFRRPVIVVRGLKTGCIIGQDSMEAEGIIIDTGRKRITFASGPIKEERCAVALTKAYTLEPHSERLVYTL
jgi:hypothetical protein